MHYELSIQPDPAAVAQAAAQRLTEIAQAAVSQRGRFRIALSGGGTPMTLYGLLAEEPYRSRLPWTETQVFWGDERFLPPGNPGRNDTAVLPLLAAAGVPSANIHPVPYIAADEELTAEANEPPRPGQVSTDSEEGSLSWRLDVAARRYEALLCQQARPSEPKCASFRLPHPSSGAARGRASELKLAPTPSEPKCASFRLPHPSSGAARGRAPELKLAPTPSEPLLDLVLLGLGSDGHIASLFPGTAALEERQRLVVPNRAVYEDRHPERITLTFPAINAAQHVIFLVTGTRKRAILRRVLSKMEDPPLPAQRVRPAGGPPLWLVDQAAASDLEPTENLL